jgi:hypothetical protein
MLPVSAQRDYYAIDVEGHCETSAKSLKSTPIQHQPNVRVMADAPDSKSGRRQGVSLRVRPSSRAPCHVGRHPPIARAQSKCDRVDLATIWQQHWRCQPNATINATKSRIDRKGLQFKVYKRQPSVTEVLR